jgi:DNA topoisomerase I
MVVSKEASASPPIAELDPEGVARSAGLRYVNDSTPGVRRKRAGRSFAYVGADGRLISDKEELARIKALAVPPAWTEVWIAPTSRGHVQATGRDARGRKQYRYHQKWRAVRDETKYGRMLAFGESLPKIRKRVKADLATSGIPREKVVAAVVALLDSTLIRVGNEAYARENRSFGLTTLRNRHVDVGRSMLRFRFRGKGGKLHDVQLYDQRLAAVIRRCQDLPGQELFQYVDENEEVRSIESADVNAYLREISGRDFTAKDFRTWAGTVSVAEALMEVGEFSSQAEAKHNVAEAIEQVARQLGNTPAVCRTCYVHPGIIEAYMDRSLPPAWEAASGKVRRKQQGLSRDEAALLILLREQLAA